MHRYVFTINFVSLNSQGGVEYAALVVGLVNGCRWFENYEVCI